MKIVSTFKDFYDYSVCPCNDDEVTWVRNTNLAVKVDGNRQVKKCGVFKFMFSTPTQYEVPQEICDKILALEKEIREHVYTGEEILIVGEKTYSLMHVKTVDEKNVFAFVWNGENFEVYLPQCRNKEHRNGTKLVCDYELIDIVDKFTSKNQIKSWLKEHGVKVKDRLNDVLYHEDIEYLTDGYINERLNGIKNRIRHVFHDVPLIHINKGVYDANPNIVLNPKLKGENWEKILNPVIIYQEIDMFLNDINLKERIVDVSNHDKIVANGFDTKSSFRNIK